MAATWTALTELTGTPLTWASEGFEPRAAEVQALVARSHAYLTSVFGAHLEPVVVIPDASDWTRYADPSVPYGIPYAADDGMDLWVPADPGQSFLVDIYAAFGPRPAAERFADLIAVHELGHLHARQLGLDLPSGWLGEFVATYLSYCFLAEHQPEDATLWTSLSRAQATSIRPAHHSLEELDELYFGVGADNYIWYQNRLTMMVERVHAALGPEFVIKLGAAGLQPTSDSASMLQAAQAVYPDFAA